MNYSDAEVIESIKKGEANNVLTFLYKSVQPKVRSWVMQNNGDADEAQDIFQDAVIAFYKYVTEDKFKEGNSVAGFIFTISKNLWINRAKQMNKLERNVEIHADKHSEEMAAESQYISNEKAEKIQEILSQLGERCKELLTYSIFYRMSMEDISVKMGFSNADTAKTKNYKCKQRLIKLFKDNSHLKELLRS